MMKQPLLLLLASCTFLFANAQTPALVEDIQPGAAVGSKPAGLTVIQGALYFGANDTTGTELWEWHAAGTPAKRLTNLYPGVGAGWYGDPLLPMGVFQNKLYYRGYISSTGQSLISATTAGAAAPVIPAPIPNPSVSSVRYYGFTVLNNRLYYIADSAGYPNAYALWSYDGTNPPTMHFKFNVSGPSAIRTGNWRPVMAAYKNKIYFDSDSSATGNEVFCFDPATGKVSLVADILPGKNGSNPREWLVSGDKLYFIANDSAHGCELWTYNGTAATRLTDILPGKADGINFLFSGELAAYDGGIFFSGQVGPSHEALYRYDTLTGNTAMVYDGSVGATSFPGRPSRFLATQNNLYFCWATKAMGRELYKYNRTGGALVADLNPGTADGLGTSNMAYLQGFIYFCGDNGATGNELYRLQDIPAPAGIISNVGWAGQITLHPNPTSSSASLDINLPTAESLNIVLSDAAGRLIFRSGPLSFNAGKTETQLPLSGHPAGQYFFQVCDAAGKRVAAGSVIKN